MSDAPTRRRMIGRLLQRFTDWALSKNAPGGYEGEDDPRWAYTISPGNDPYLTRVLLSRLLGLKKFLGFGVYLHHFHRPDADTLHNHPWTWAVSFVLSGSYTEERLDHDSYLPFLVSTAVRRVRWFNTLTKDDYHAVKKLHGDVWTLFITGPRAGEVADDGSEWGFLVDGKHVPERTYLGKPPITRKP